MSEKSISELSLHRILISLMLFAAVPVITCLINSRIRMSDISLTAAFSTAGFFLLSYDWNLFAIHYNRCKHSPSEAFFYTVSGFLMIGILFLFNRWILHGTVILPDRTSLVHFGYARPGMYAAFSYVQAMILAITCKCISDRFHFKGKIVRRILIMGFAEALVYLFAFLPVFPGSALPTLIYNSLLFFILGYLYNQSRSFLPGLLAMGTVYLLAMIL